MVILSTLESLPTHIVTLPFTSLCLFRNSRFELLLLATEPTQGRRDRRRHASSTSTFGISFRPE